VSRIVLVCLAAIFLVACGDDADEYNEYINEYNTYNEYNEYYETIMLGQLPGASGNQWNLTTLQTGSPVSSPVTINALYAAATFSFAGDYYYRIEILDTVVERFPLTNPWDISSTQATDKEVDISTVGAGANSLRGLFINPDGTRIYVGDTAGIFAQATLSTPYDPSTAGAFTEVDKSSSFSSSNNSIYISPDGVYLFTRYNISSGNGGVARFTMSTPWDLTSMGSATLDAASSSLYDDDYGIHFSNDGTLMYTGDGNSGIATRWWSLSTAWLPSSKTNLGKVSGTLRPVHWRPDGLRFFTSDGKHIDAGS